MNAITLHIEDNEKNRKASKWFLSHLNSEKYIRAVDISGIVEIIDNSVGAIIREKNISEDGVLDFIKKFSANVEYSDLPDMINLLASPPFEIHEYLNSITDIKDMSKSIGLNDYKWLTNHKFPGGSNVGAFEAFLIVLFQKMSNPSIGDVMYNKKDIIEVKGAGGRLRGQSGYNNGLIPFLDEMLIQMNYKCPKNKLDYNISKDTIDTYKEKIVLGELELKEEKEKYDKNLNEKLLRMQETSGVKITKKYLNAKEQFEKYKNSIPRSIEKLQEEIKKLEEDITNCIIENISIDLAKESLEKSIAFLTRIFSKKYSNANMLQLEKFIRAGLNDNGSFNSKFLIEYFIFEFEYYQQIEKFKYFCLVNLNEDIMLIIDSPEKFREFVCSKNIVIKSSPSFSEYAGQQGMVFALDLKR